jgi:2-methylcitrate dehydratase
MVMRVAAENITAPLARWAADLRFENLSPEALHEIKRFLLDSIGCALGGYTQHDVKILLDVLEETATPGPATLIGGGRNIDVLSATLANSLMVRVMDYNDIYWQQDPSHPSDIIPAVLACGQRAKVNGKELCVGIAIAYEMQMRLCEAAFPGIRERGWHHATLTSLAAPFAAGRMLRLPWETIQRAVGISGSNHACLGAVTAGELSMMKNTVDPLATQGAVLSVLLAEKGFGGPKHVIDGKEGLVHCLGPDWKLDILTDGLGDSWRITRCGMKAYPTEALTHAPISAFLDIVSEHGLKPEMVESVHIRGLPRLADILADPSKYNPNNKETADHSLPYCIAAALVDGQVTPLQFTNEKIMDPVVRFQLHKVKVIADQEFEMLFPAIQRVEVTVATADGRKLKKQLDYPKGDPRNPLSDREVEEKFDALAEPLVSARTRQSLKDTIWKLDGLSSADDLMKLMRADA